MPVLYGHFVIVSHEPESGKQESLQAWVNIWKQISIKLLAAEDDK